jgi:hypothetical protein
VHFLPGVLRALKGGAALCASTVALRNDPYQAGVPAHVASVVGWEAASWHSPAWWARHWELSGLLTGIQARWQEGGRDDWLAWERARQQLHADPAPSLVLGMLEADVHEDIGFALLTALKKQRGI